MTQVGGEQIPRLREWDQTIAPNGYKRFTWRGPDGFTAQISSMGPVWKLTVNRAFWGTGESATDALQLLNDELEYIYRLDEARGRRWFDSRVQRCRAHYKRKRPVKDPKTGEILSYQTLGRNRFVKCSAQLRAINAPRNASGQWVSGGKRGSKRMPTKAPWLTLKKQKPATPRKPKLVPAKPTPAAIEEATAYAKPVQLSLLDRILNRPAQPPAPMPTTQAKPRKPTRRPTRKPVAMPFPLPFVLERQRRAAGRRAVMLPVRTVQRSSGLIARAAAGGGGAGGRIEALRRVRRIQADGRSGRAPVAKANAEIRRLNARWRLDAKEISVAQGRRDKMPGSLRQGWEAIGDGFGWSSAEGAFFEIMPMSIAGLWSLYAHVPEWSTDALAEFPQREFTSPAAARRVAADIYTAMRRNPRY